MHIKFQKYSGIINSDPRSFSDSSKLQLSDSTNWSKNEDQITSVAQLGFL